MNVRDSQIIAGLMLKAGYKITEEVNDADIIIFNTCSVRKHAEDKVWSEIGRVSKLNKNLNQRPIIGLVGCMAQAYKEKVFERTEKVDFVVGPSDIDKIPEIVNSLTEYNPLQERKIWQTDGNRRPEHIYHLETYPKNDHAYIVISEGCSNFCSYCIVPYVRGHLKNRNHKDIILEVKEALDKGIDKFTLLGQNVNAYHDNEVNFIKLLSIINGINGIKEFSFITSHPKDTKKELFEAMENCQKINKYLHLPIQSGSDRILKLMRRGYTVGEYKRLAEEYRRIVKNGVLSTDIIVGFPSESEEDFTDTYNLVKELEFNCAYIFKYSPRPFTEAAKFADDVPKKEKERRHRLILELQKKIFQKKKLKK